ncbi:MAG: S46 family peptidase [Candidatus Eisenbacteria bacterium]
MMRMKRFSMLATCRALGRPLGPAVRPIVLGLVGSIWVTASLACFSQAQGAEGMWLPQELPDRIMQEMHANGLQLGKEEIWNSAGTGVANAVVRVGATGAFVSGDGLILTNHHVAFGSVQRISTRAKNYMEKGFLARTRAEEVPALGYMAYVMQSSQDVTDQILSATAPSMSPLERYYAIEKKTKQLIKEAEARAGEAGQNIECEISSFFGGARYLLYTYLKIRDVRVVYVPSRAIGEYGGEVDNWMWPRHAGDFSFLRAYVAPDGSPADFSEGNVPFRPKRYLKIAPQGLKDGDFAFIIGFPRTTHRYLTSYALVDYQIFELAETVRLNRQMVEILEARANADPAAAILVAGRMKGLNNYIKKDTGVLAGITKFDLVKRQQRMEERLPGEKYGIVLNGFRSLYDERTLREMKDLLLEYGTKEGLLGQAMLLYKWSIEKTRDDLDRDPEFMDREVPDLRQELDLFQKGFDPASDRAILKMLLVEMAILPAEQRVRALDATIDKMSGEELNAAIEALLDGLYAGTRLGEREERMALFDLSRKALLERNDAFVAFAARLYPENQERIAREKSFAGSLEILTPQWMGAVAEASKRESYPDANSTLRLSYGAVKGYAPRDAVWYKPFTTLAGVVEKSTGIAPFNCPEAILDLAVNKTYGPYADPALGDVPVDLLTTHDSTNGNSGSPLLNAKGELVGCLFDGNYEALSGDLAFDENLNRSIHVDIRYVLWIARYVDSAENVLTELGVK